MMRLAGKTAFISGGARGMGAAEVGLFIAEGASVAFGDVLEEDGRALEADIARQGGQAMFLPLDVTSAAQWQAAIDATVSRFGRLDVLVNNAGVRGDGLVEDVSGEEWDRVMDINAKGTFLGTRAALPAMRRNGGGSIVNISSQLGLVGVDNSSSQYQASKGAVRIFTKATAIQYAGDGIRANSVHPGPIATPMTEGGRSDPDRFNTTVSRIPLGRYGQPEDVAFGVLFLASDESSFMTGSELVIDGGWTAQ
ncbi:MAG: SDR family oxidoreductase [Chloroflexota bacterium]|nr:SDR family oxidoreductase [Chloroflexota bacterium]